MGVGDSWGTKEELQHPRDKNGRFRNTWKMAAGVIDKILATLSSFNPKTFASDEEAAGYVHSRARANRYLTNRGPAIERFLKDYGKINADVRAGKPNADAAAIKKGMSPLPDDLILSRVMGPEAFGLNAQNVGQVEELTGKLVKDKGFSATNVGTPMPHAPGAITMSIVAPKGTKAVLPSTSRPTREVILDTDQPYRITKVDPDGQGGFYVYAVATGESKNESAVDIRSAVPGADVEEGTGGEVPGGQGGGTGTEVPVVPGGGGAAGGGGVEERRDGHVGIVGQGPGGEGTGEVVPEIPEEGTDTRSTFREAFEEAQLKVPTVGQRRKQYMDAFNGIASGKKTPQEAVRELDDAIAVNKRILASDAEDGTDSGPLGEDIKRQEALSNLIKEHYNFTGRKPQKKTTAPEKENKKAAVPEKKTVPPKKLGVAGGKPVKEEQIRKATGGGKKKTPLSDELNSAYTRTNLVGLRKIADDNGIKVPGDKKTKRDVFEHIVKELKRKEGIDVPEEKAPEVKAPVKKAAVKAPRVPAKKVAPVKKTAVSEKEADDRITRLERERKAQTRKELREARVKRGEEPEKRTPRKTAGEVPLGKTTLEGTAVRDQWLKDAGVNYDDLSDTDKAGVNLFADQVAAGKLSRAEAKRRLSASSSDSLKKISGSVTSRPTKKAADIPETPGDIDKMTIPQLRAEAKRQNKRIPSTITRKADIVEFLKGDEDAKVPEKKVAKKAAVKKVVPEKKAPVKKISGRKQDTPERRKAVTDNLKDLRKRLADNETANKSELGVPPLVQVIDGWVTKVESGELNEADIKNLLGRLGGVRYGASDDPDVRRISKELLDTITRLEGGDVPEVKAPEVKAPEAGKPLWGTFKTHGIKPGDIVMYHGSDRRKGPGEGRKVRVVNHQGGFVLEDVETGKTVRSGGWANRSWYSRVDVDKKKPVNTDKGLEFMTVPELRKKAADEEIEIPKNLKSKKEIVDFLADALAGKDIEKREAEKKAPEVKKVTGPTAAEKAAALRQQREEARQKREQERLEKKQAAEKEKLERKQAREEAAAEKKAAAEKDAEDRRVAKEARMRLAGEKRRLREQEAEKKRLEQEQKKETRDLDAKIKEDQIQAQIRAIVARGGRDNDNLLAKGWTLGMFREFAKRNNIKIPTKMKDKEEIREHLIEERLKQRAASITTALGRREMIQGAEAEGIDLSFLRNFASDESIATEIARQRQVLADMGIDRTKYVPKVSTRKPTSVLGMDIYRPRDWDEAGVPRDTDPNHPYVFHNFTGAEGYKARQVVVTRRNGITTITEVTEKELGNPYAVAQIQKDFYDFHESSPGAKRYQHQYGWYRDANPGDKYWQKKFKNKDHMALASASSGTMQFWGQNPGGAHYGSRPAKFIATLRHELGHNVDSRGTGTFFSSDEPHWKNTAQRDSDHAAKIRSFEMSGYLYRELTLKVDHERAWPWGVTSYGKSSSHEDYAESISLYLGNEILGYGIPERENRPRPLYFRDLFPSRARELDDLFPDEAQKQKKFVKDAQDAF